MTYHGQHINDSILAQCISRMKVSSFRARDIAFIAEVNGISTDVAYRVADKLIQRERKKKHISYDKGIWSPVPDDDNDSTDERQPKELESWTDQNNKEIAGRPEEL